MRYILILALFFITLAPADVIDLTNGETVSGGIVQFEDNTAILGGKRVERGEITRITLQSDRQQDYAEQASRRQFDKIANVDYLIKRATEAEKEYPDASGIVIIDHGTYELKLDGSRTYSYHFAGKILDQSTLGWGQRSLGFEEGRSRVKINYARVISPEGEIAWWDTSDYTISEPSEGGVFFSYGKVLSATFPGVGIGSIVEYHFESETYNPFDRNFFTPGFYFQDDVPTLESRCTVTIPRDKKLNYRNYNWPKGNDSPSISEDENTITYEWLIENSPPFLEEPQAPSYGDLVPRVDASLFQDWDYIYGWLGGLMESRMVATEEIKAKVGEITEGATNMADSINRIYIWVQREIHYISIKGSVASGQTGHEAQFTFEKKYGDCTDKSILFSTMLREIGVEAYPIILMTNDEEDIPRDIPDLSGNHAITLVYLDGKKVFLDPTSTTHVFPYYRSDDVGVTYVCPLCRDWDTTYIPQPEDNAQHIEIHAVLDKNGDMTAKYVASYTGDYEAGYRGFWESQPAENREIVLQNWMSYSIPGAEVTNWTLPGVDDLTVPFREEMQLRVNSYPTQAADLWILQMPEVENKLSFKEVSLGERRFPIEYTAPYRESHRITFELPEGTKIEYLPEDIEIENAYAGYSASYSIIDGKVVFEDTYDLKKRIVPPEDYKEYRAFCRRISQYVHQKVFLRRPI